jgi:hypothetical protein
LTEIFKVARYVSFQSNRFDSTTVKPHFINPETGFGEDVVVWIKEHVQHPDIVLDSPIQEDYGWGIWANVHAAPYWIAVSLIRDDETDQPEWYMTIVYERGCHPLRRIPPARTEDLMLLSHAIDAALHADSAITEIGWWQNGFYDGEPDDHPE